MNDEREWDYYNSALAGLYTDLPRGKVASGYYRSRSKAVAIWRDGGKLICWVNGRQWTGTRDDPWDGSEVALAEKIFSWCSRAPISYETYTAFIETGKWPEDISGDIAAARQADPAEVELEPHAAVAAEVETTWRAFEAWLASIGGKITTEEHDAKASKFKDEFLALETKAERAFAEEKRPWLEGGREVDKKWRGAKARPEELKKAVAKAAEPYRLERKRIADVAAEEERRKAAAAVAKAREQNVAPPIPISRPKAPTGLRTRKVTVLTDTSAFLRYLATLNAHSEDLLAALRTSAGRMIVAGVDVPGAEIRDESYAA